MRLILLIFTAISLPVILFAQDIPLVRPGKFIYTPPTNINQANSFAITGSSDLFVCTNPLGRIIICTQDGISRGEFDVGFSSQTSPSDIASDGGTGIFICEPYQTKIAHLNRNGTILPSVNLPNDRSIEPVTLAAMSDGRLLVLNIADGDIWRIERDNRCVPLLISPRAGNFDNARLELSPDENRLVLLENNKVRIFRPQGEPLPSPTPKLNRIVDIAVSNDGLWLIGDGLEFIPFVKGALTFNLNVEVLKHWNVYPPIGIVVKNDRMYILTTDAKIFSLSLRSPSLEQR